MTHALYLAGPEVFLSDSDALGALKRSRCAAAGFDAHYPGDVVSLIDDFAELRAMHQGSSIYEALVAQLDECDAVIANITPFRGPSADVGTAWECGYAVARGLPVFAYSNVTAHYEDRVEPDGFHIESFGFADNLMVEWGAFGGGGIVRTECEGDPHAVIADLRGFDACLRRATKHFQAI